MDANGLRFWMIEASQWSAAPDEIEFVSDSRRIRLASTRNPGP